MRNLFFTIIIPGLANYFLRYACKGCLIFAGSLFCLSAARGQAPTEAFQQAKAENKVILLVFSGSDWCIPCKRIEQNIFADSSFIRFAGEHLVILTADFPQRRKLTPRQIRWNDSLAEIYNPQGIFPLLLLLKPDQTVLTSLAYEQYSGPSFVEQIKRILQMNNLLKEYARREKLMGSAFEFLLTAGSQSEADVLLQDCVNEVTRIEKLLTEFDPGSETSQLNQYAAIQPVTVSNETHALIQRSLNLSRLTMGAFDITAAVLKPLYQFKKEAFAMPAPEQIAFALQKTGYNNIRLLPGNRVSFTVPGLYINFAAIGKGYAADKVKELMMQKAVPGGVINASGDLTAWGHRPDGSDWKAGIADPDMPGRMLMWISLQQNAIATSGNYEQYFLHEGKRYSHNIDPRTGYPVQGIRSVSIISPAAELSDALATAVTVLGINKGMALLNQLPQTHGILIDADNRVYHSKNIQVNSKTA